MTRREKPLLVAGPALRAARSSRNTRKLIDGLVARGITKPARRRDAPCHEIVTGTTAADYVAARIGQQCDA